MEPFNRFLVHRVLGSGRVTLKSECSHHFLVYKRNDIGFKYSTEINRTIVHRTLTINDKLIIFCADVQQQYGFSNSKTKPLTTTNQPQQGDTVNYAICINTSSQHPVFSQEVTEVETTATATR